MQECKHPHFTSLAVVAVALLGLPQAAAAQGSSLSSSNSLSDRIEFDDALPITFGFLATSRNGINSQHPLYQLEFRPYISYQIAALKNTAATLYVDMSKEITDTGVTTSKRELVFDDVALEFANGKILTESHTGINWTGRLRFQVPTSKAADYETRRFRTVIGTGVNRKVFIFNPGFEYRFTKNFHQYTTSQTQGLGNRPVDENFEIAPSGQVPTLSLRVDDFDTLNTGRTNASFSNTFRTYIHTDITEDILFVTELWFVNSYKYKAAFDVDRGRSDSFIGVFELDWQINPHFVLAAGLQTVTPQLDSTMDGYRNPFYKNNWDNLTTFYVYLDSSI